MNSTYRHLTTLMPRIAAHQSSSEGSVSYHTIHTRDITLAYSIHIINGLFQRCLPL